MKIADDSPEKYDELAELFRKIVVLRLKDLLDKTNIDQDTKTSICGEFISELAAILDFGVVEADGARCRPVIGFVKGDQVSSENESLDLIVPYAAYQHHDKTWDEIDSIFEQ